MSQGVRQFYSDLNWCGCGDPSIALTFMRDVLRLIKNNALPFRERYDALRALLGEPNHPGLYWSYFYMLDAAGLTEHGGNVSGGWLTGYGETILAELEAADLDNFDPSAEAMAEARQRTAGLTVTRNTFLGFPLVVDYSVPPGRMEMRLEEDEGNQTGKIEIHGQSFVAAPGDAIELFFRGELIYTIEFIASPLFDSFGVEPQIGPELQRFVESLRTRFTERPSNPLRPPGERSP